MAKASSVPSLQSENDHNKDDEELIRLRSGVGYQVRQTYQMVEEFMQFKLSQHDIPIGMLYFLRTLWIQDGLTQRDLSRRVGFSAPTTLEQLRKMEQRGLITMERDASDRRKSRVVLKPEAKRLKAPLLKYVDEMNRVAFCDFSTAEIDLFRHMLERVRENIRNDMRPIKSRAAYRKS